MERQQPVVGLVGQRHALSAGDDFGGVAPGDGKTGRPADGHRVTRWGRPVVIRMSGGDVRRRRFYARKADGPFDGRPPPARRRARQPGLQYGLVAERHVTVNMVIIVVVVVVVVTTGRHGSGPVAGDLEPVTTVFVAVAVRAGARGPRLAREHHGGLTRRARANDGGGHDTVGAPGRDERRAHRTATSRELICG